VSKDSTPNSPPTESTAAATWTSRWVSTPPVTGRVASTMGICHPFLCKWVQGLARTSREGDRDERAVAAASSIALRNGACLVEAGEGSEPHQHSGGSGFLAPTSLTGQSVTGRSAYQHRQGRASEASSDDRGGAEPDRRTDAGVLGQLMSMTRGQQRSSLTLRGSERDDLQIKSESKFPAPDVFVWTHGDVLRCCTCVSLTPFER
jgi:hypothetical protein